MIISILTDLAMLDDATDAIEEVATQIVEFETDLSQVITLLCKIYIAIINCHFHLQLAVKWTHHCDYTIKMGSFYILGLGIIMCGIYYCITCMCKSHLHLVSFLFVPALYYTLFVYLL